MYNSPPHMGAHTVMVGDDSMEEVSKSKTAMDIFKKHSHHRNMTGVIFGPRIYGLTHNTRIISQIARLTILFKNPRDASSFQTLGRQMYPGNHMFSLSHISTQQRDHTATLW